MNSASERPTLVRRVARAVRTRVVDPTVALLKQGITPRAIAASMASGAVIGVFPVLGTSTAICLVVALVTRLNLVAMQALNWLVYPVQVLLIIPFIGLGQRLFSDAPVAVSLVEIQSGFEQGWIDALGRFGMLLLNAAIAWAIVAAPVGLLLYLVLVVVLQRTNIVTDSP